MNPGTQTRTRTRTNENIQIHLAQEPVLRARRGVEEVEMFEPGGPVGLGPTTRHRYIGKGDPPDKGRVHHKAIL